MIQKHTCGESILAATKADSNCKYPFITIKNTIVSFKKSFPPHTSVKIFSGKLSNFYNEFEFRTGSHACSSENV